MDEAKRMGHRCGLEPMGVYWWMRADLVSWLFQLSHTHRALKVQSWSITIVDTSCILFIRLLLFWPHLIFINHAIGLYYYFLYFIKKWSHKKLKKLIQGYTAHTWQSSYSNSGNLVPASLFSIGMLQCHTPCRDILAELNAVHKITLQICCNGR